MKTTLKFFVQNLENKNILVTFPELENSTCEMHSGNHINSKENWSKFVPHGNSKKTSNIFELQKKYWRDFQITITEMVNIDEKKYPNQIKYRLVVCGNFGLKGYIQTSDMRLTKESFQKLTYGLTPRIGKNYKQFEL